MGCNIYYLFIYLFLVLLLLYTYLGHKLKFNRTPLIVDTIRYWNVVYLIPIPPAEWRCFHRGSIFDKYCYRVWTRRICTYYQYIVCILNICNYRNLPGKYRSIIIAISFNSYGIFIFTFLFLGNIELKFQSNFWEAHQFFLRENLKILFRWEHLSKME